MNDPHQDQSEQAAAEVLPCDGFQVSDPVPVKPRRAHRATRGTNARTPKRSNHKKPRAPVRTKRHTGITRTRTVWGRRKTEVDGREYVIEMGADGVRVIERRGGITHATLPWFTLIKLSVRQRELFDAMGPALVDVLRQAMATPADPPSEAMGDNLLAAGVQGGSDRPVAS